MIYDVSTWPFQKYTTAYRGTYYKPGDFNCNTEGDSFWFDY